MTIPNDEEGQRAEDVVDALERAAMGCGDAINYLQGGDTKLAPARSVSFKSQENKTSERRRRVLRELGGVIRKL